MPSRLHAPQLTRRAILRGIGAATIGTAAGAAAHGFMYERHHIEVTEETLEVIGWPSPLSGLRIGFVTDLHRSATVSHEMIAGAVQLLMSHRPDLIAIGSSTGGVEALQTLLAGFPADCPPTVIVQHVNPRFAPAIAKTLDLSSPATVVLAEPDMPLKPGHAYLAPGDDRHLTVGGTAGKYYARLRPGNPVSGHLPSVDMLFGSAAQVVGQRAVGALLTGMGSDGARGLLAMAQAGAATIAQDEATCTVFGMPRAAISLGAASIVAPIGEIAQYALGKAA